MKQGAFRHPQTSNGSTSSRALSVYWPCPAEGEVTDPLQPVLGYHEYGRIVFLRQVSIPSFGLKLGLAILVLLAAVGVEAGPYREGQPLEITGSVTDAEGMPVPDVTVVLKVRRKAFSFKKMGRTTRDTVEVSTRTDARGEYSLEWRWYDYYNRFELKAGVPVRKPGEEELEVLAEVDLGARMKQGSPVIANLVIEDTRFVDSLRDFVADLDSDAKREVYDEVGKPDRVQIIQYPTFDEVTWWYFQVGRAYRFRAGELDQIEEFDPVSPFQG